MICRINDSKLELVVSVHSFFSLPDNGPKTWFQRRTLPTKVVDLNSFGLLQLVDFIAEHCLWGSKQYITLWRDLENDDSMEIKSDENLLEWCLVNVQSGLVCINAQINDFEGPLQFSPTKRRLHPIVRASMLSIEEGTSERDTNDTSNTPPKRKKISTKKKRAPVVDSASEADGEVLSDSSYDSDLAASSESDDAWSDSETEFDPNGEVFDEEDDYDPPMFSYDADDPCIDVNTVFPDVDQCKLAVTHHAVLHDHAFHTVQKDKTIFRAICKRAEQGCKWNFFANTSKAKKYIGCKVNDY